MQRFQDPLRGAHHPRASRHRVQENIPSLAAETRVALAPTSINDDELVTLWLSELGHKTQVAYRHDVGTFRQFVGKPLANVTPLDVVRWRQNLTGSPNYVARRLSAMRSLFAFATSIGSIAVNPSLGVKRPRSRSRVASRTLSMQQVRCILDAARSRDRDYVMLRLLYASGVRVSELCSIRIEDIDRDQKAFRIVVRGKGSKERVICIDRKTSTLVRRFLSTRRTGKLFEGSCAEEISTSTVWRAVRRAATKAGLSSAISPHWFRHANASHAIARGCDLVTVRDSLGHSSLAVTNVYAHALAHRSPADFIARNITLR